MNTRFAAPIASAAIAILLLGACSDAGSTTTLAKGNDVDLFGDDGLGAQTLTITAEEEDGEVTGEFRVTDVVVTVECADTATDDVVILGGEVTNPGDEPSDFLGELLALVIEDGDPDRVALFANDHDAGSCAELLESIPEEELTDGSNFVDVEAGEDIETG